MREILFRGKRSVGERSVWTYGDLTGVPKENFYTIFEQSSFGRNFQVNPETVGQFTGLCDITGKKIFEGDIIRQYNKYHDAPKSYDVYTVIYEEVDCCFYGKQESQSGTTFVRLWAGTRYEVIGNIWDNPELLVEAEHEQTD